MGRSHLLVLVVFILLVCSPLFATGFYTSQDGPNHLVRIAHFYSLLTQGHIVPGWDQSLNAGLGYPLFYFTYPLPYYLTSLCMWVGLGVVDSLKVILILATTLSAVFMYKWLASVSGRKYLALAGSLVFLLTPYRFTNLYVRVALGEIVFLSLAPLVLWSLDRKKLWFSSAATTLLILSHLQLSLIFIPILIIYAIIKNYRPKELIKLNLLPLLLSAFFWLPALVLVHYTKFSQITQFNPVDHIPGIRSLLYSPWGFGFSPSGMSFQLGIANWFVLILAIVFVFTSNKRLNLSLIVSIIALILMTEVSSGLWNLPQLKPIQFPWRLLMLPLIFIPSLILSIKNKLLLVMLVLLAVFANRNHIRTNLPDFVGASDHYFLTSSTTTTSTPDEFMPLKPKEFFESHPIIYVSQAITAIAILFLGFELLKSTYGYIRLHHRS